VPLPVVEYVSTAGFAFAAAMRSGNVLNGAFAKTMNAIGDDATTDTGAKSRIES
jgi:hypothetical protein